MKPWTKPGYLVVTASLLLLGQKKQSPIEPKALSQTSKSDEKRPNQKDSENSQGPIDVLSDTGGVDVHPYVSRVAQLVKAKWYELIPESAAKKRGKVTIRFKVRKDGQIGDIRVVESSGDLALDRPAWGGISSSSPLPSLPIDYTCGDLYLQFRFYYNLDIPPVEYPKGDLIPCVRSRIGYVQPVAISVAPVSVEVITGEKQQFSARVIGDENAEVKWTVSGSGCSESTCGSVSAQGLYLAPGSIPNPPKVIVTATSASDPSETANATVTVVKSPTPR